MRRDQREIVREPYARTVLRRRVLQSRLDRRWGDGGTFQRHRVRFRRSTAPILTGAALPMRVHRFLLQPRRSSAEYRVRRPELRHCWSPSWARAPSAWPAGRRHHPPGRRRRAGPAAASAERRARAATAGLAATGAGGAAGSTCAPTPAEPPGAPAPAARRAASAERPAAASGSAGHHQRPVLEGHLGHADLLAGRRRASGRRHVLLVRRQVRRGGRPTQRTRRATTATRPSQA